MPQFPQSGSMDSLRNLLTHIGDPRDKQAYSHFIYDKRHYRELEDAYRTWLPNKLTRIIPEDMTREGRTVTMTDEDPDEFHRLEEDLDVFGRLCDAYSWGRLYGGGGVYVVMGDREDPELPLSVDRVSPQNPVVALVDFDMWDVETRISEDARSSRFLRPEWYRFNTNQQWIHWTRVLGPFDGYRLPNRLQKDNYGWGGSEVERISEVALQSLSANASVASLLHRADVTTMGIQGLLGKTANASKTRELQQRFEVAQVLMSNNSFLLYDKDQEIPGQVQASLTAPGNLITEFLSLVAAAADIPVTRFFGTAPKGLNATGEGDRRNYHMTIKGKQSRVFGPWLRYLDRLLVRSTYGRDVKMTFEWNLLEQPTELERAQAASVWADTHTKYVTMGAITASMVSQELLATGEYDALDQDFVDALKQVEGFEDEASEGEAQQNGETDPGDPEDVDQFI